MEDLWKSIESDRPAFGEDVLVFTAAGEFHVAALMEDGESWMTGTMSLISSPNPVTHWQPLTPPRPERAAA